MPQNTSLGKDLKRARELRNLSLRDVEKATGVSNAYLSQLETEKIKKPSAYILHKLAKLYDTNFEVFLNAAGLISTSPPKNSPNTISGSALYSKNLTIEEEKELTKYLLYLRQQK